MASNLLRTYGVTEFLQRTTHPNYIEIISQEYSSIPGALITGTGEKFKESRSNNENQFQTIYKEDSINTIPVDGFDLNGKFIVTEQPTESTLNSFWNMVVSTNSHVIVMLSDVEEELRPTSIPYLSSNQINTIFKDFIVTQKEINLEKNYTETVLNITYTGTGHSQIVHHFKYWNWPKCGFPEEKEFLKFLLVINKKYQDFHLEEVIDSGIWAGPILVHGKAGTGRTATFCAIDTCLNQLVCKETISVQPVVVKIRDQMRNFSLPDVSQYIFIHHVLCNFLKNIRSNLEAFIQLRSFYTARDLYLSYHPRGNYLSISLVN
ncbi:PTP5 [Bracoviriform indiense]|uniref:PTP5 n=1 Tax=Bracoviriform indiense TaxID=116759 RepID=Q2THV3_9VIRU|nr:PTP5 [Bracoviriform indiense]AAZ30026.1 PTP5 [Bracoviriform indiense]